MAERRKTDDRTYRSTTKRAPDFPKAYVRLRTVLDGLQISVLRYCLEEENAKIRIKRMTEIEKTVLPMIRAIQDKLALAPGPGCPDGYFDCGGICVPYQCPGSETK